MSEASNEKILPQAEIWSHNRRLYPGWLVAPNEIRQRLWYAAPGWIEAVVSASSDLEAEQSLWLLYELNWRLETALLPMFEDIAAAVEKVLRHWCRGTGEAKSANCVELPIGIPGEPATDRRPDIRTMWKELALGLLRFHREERHHEAFSRWLELVTKAEPLSDDERSRLCYERALQAVCDLDDSRALNALTDWPDDCRDPVWAVRKAALYAELGELAAAESLATEALNSLRQNTMRHPADIPNLSREGWTMLLLDSVAWARHFENRSRPHTENLGGRLTQLSKFHCNPWIELAWFESRLDQPAPTTPPRVTLKAEFEPGKYRRTYHGGDQGFGKKLSVAYQWMRLIEEAPCPPAVGNVVLSSSALRHAAEWFIEHDPVRTQTLVFRLRDKDLTHDYLSRHRIAALPSTGAAGLHELAERSLGDTLPRLAGSETRGDASAERKRHRLSTSIDVLARTVVREPIANCVRLWDTALKLYESLPVRMDFASPTCLFRLFHSLIDSLADAELERRFQQIIELPIPGSKSFHVLNSLDWQELTRYAEGRLHRLSAHVVHGDWTSVTERLLQAARDEKPLVRRCAVIRLAALFRYGCLDETASKKLAEAYWSQQTPEGLPRVEGMLPWTCLTLPEPEPDVSVERFRAYASQRRLESGSEIDLLNNWIGATRVATEAVEQNRRFVDWTSDEIRGMVERMKEWWDRLDIAAHEQRASRPAGVWMGEFGKTPYPECLPTMLDVLRYVIIPRIQDDAETIAVVSTLVDDFANRGLPVAAVLPALQTIRPSRDVAPEMRRALASHESHVYSSALEGLVHWLEIRHVMRPSSRAMIVPEVPGDLLRELGMIVATRRQPGLLEALGTVARVLQNCPETTADEHFLDSIVVALECLWVETEYRSFGRESDRIPYSDVPECRKKAARIASLLQKTPAGETETVRQWIAAALNDPLPEVRRAVVDAADVSPESGRPITVGALLCVIEAAVPEQISSEEKDSLRASVPLLLQRAEFASSLDVVPLEEQLQLAALLVVHISQTLSSAKAAQSAIEAIVSYIVVSPSRLSSTEASQLRAIALRDDRTNPDDTLVWLRTWTSGTENRGEKRRRSHKNKTSRRKSRRRS